MKQLWVSINKSVISVERYISFWCNVLIPIRQSGVQAHISWSIDFIDIKSLVEVFQLLRINKRQVIDCLYLPRTEIIIIKLDFQSINQKHPFDIRPRQYESLV